MNQASRKACIGEGGVGQDLRGEVQDRTLGQGMIIRQCPVTCGLPTRMTIPAWERACRNAQAMAEGDGNQSIYNGFQKRAGKFCVLCRGEAPAELELIRQAEIMGETMGAVKGKNGACDLCGKKATTRSNHGVQACSLCQQVQARVANSPGLVIRILRGMVPAEKLAELLDAEAGIGLTVESSALQAVAELVGYTGTDGDELLQAVAVATSASEGQQRRIEVLAEELELAHGRLKELDDTMDALREILEIPEDVAVVDAVRDLSDDWRGMLLAEGWKPNPDTIRALGLPEGTTSWSPVEMAAMQIAALLEDTERDLYQVEMETAENLTQAGIALTRVRIAAGVEAGADDDLEGSANKIIEAIAHMGAGMERLQEQLAAASDELAGWKPVVRDALESICTELGLPGDVEMHEIARHVAELRRRADSVGLSEATWGTIEATTPGRRPVLDSHLLDLLIEFPQIGAERIAVLREVE